MSASIADSISGKVRQLDAPTAATTAIVSEADVTDARKLAELLTRAVRLLAVLDAQWVPRRIDFQDVSTITATTVTLTHRLGGRVRWWVVDAQGEPPNLLRDAATTPDALVLACESTGTYTIRVEEAG